MSVPQCYEKTKEYLKSIGRTVSTADLREMAIALSERQAHTLSAREFTLMAEDLFSTKLAKDASARRAARLINLQKAEQAFDIVNQKIKGSTIARNMEAWILGNSRRMGEAVNISVADIKKSLTSQWLRQVRSTLNENLGDLKVAESGLLTKEITQELASLERGGGKASSSEQAHRIAKVYHGVMGSIFETKQAFDPFLGKIQDYYFRATHDRVKISAVDQETWVTSAMSAYGEKSFPELTAEKKVQAFQNVYNQIKRGVYESSLDLDSEPGDIMKKMAKSRTLIPNSWESFHAYNEQFGRGNVHSTVLRSIETAAHDISVIQKFGSSPKDSFNAVMRKAIATGTAEDVDLLKASHAKLSTYFDVAIQPAQAPGTGQFARFMRGLMGVQTLAKNGSSFLRSWADLANFTRRITDDVGGNYLSNFVEAVTEYGKQFGSSMEARTAAMEDMYLYSRTALHNLYQEVGGEASISATGPSPFEANLGKMIQLQSKLSLMDRHISSMDAGMAVVLSRRLGQMTETAFKDLAPETIQGLTRYGIKEAEWKLLQKGVESWEGRPGVDLEMGNMKRLLNVDSVQAIPKEAIADYLQETGKWKGKTVPKQAIERARTEIASQIGAMVNQHADAASSSSGLAERAWMFGNSDPNSFSGQTLRLVAQFKSAMVKNYDTQMRSYYSNPAKLEGDYTKVVQHVLMASSLWAAGETAKTVFSGKTPEPVSPLFMAKALLSSGAAGLIGDSILSEVTRNSNAKDIAGGVVKGLGGPSVGAIADVTGFLGQMGYSSVDSSKRFPGAQLGQVVTQNVPMQNLFYTKALFNYYFANGLRDWLDPGYLARMDQSTARKGQEQFAFHGSAF